MAQIVTRRMETPAERAAIGLSPAARSSKPQVVRQIAHAPRHDADLGMRQSAQSWFMKMVEMGMGEEYEVDRGQILYFKTGALDALQQKEPVRKIRVNQHIEIGELNEKGGMPDPGNGHFPVF